MNPIITERKNSLSVKAYVQGNEDIYELGENESIAISKLLLRLQGKAIRTWSGSFLLACFSWLSLFSEMWLMLTGHIEGGGMEWSFLVFFFLTSIFSSSMAMRK